MADVLAAAAAALGEDLTGPAELVGSDRSAVLRCRSPGRGSVVVKTYPATGEGAESFAAEAAGLALAADAGLGPRLLAVDRRSRVIVMTDLGDVPSLADLLLGGPPGPAARALQAWARACGELAVRTAGRQSDLDRLRAFYRAGGHPGADPASPAGHWLVRRVREIPGLLARLSIPPPGRLAADLAAVAEAVGSADYAVFSPGDICPDNNLLTASGVRFIDFESAEFHPAFLDAAYLSMPFGTCWCVFRLPGEVAGPARAAYREMVSEVYPDLADDGVWQPGVRLACAAWTLHALVHLLEASLRADLPMNDGPLPAPTARVLLRYRWHWLRAELDQAGELPAISALMSALLERTARWAVPDLPVYPGLR